MGKPLQAGPLPIRTATLADWTREAPQRLDEDGNRQWVLRTLNFAVEVTEVRGRAVLQRSDNPDEYMLVVPAGLRARVQAGGDTAAGEQDTLFIVPPGDSRATLGGDGLAVRIFSHRAEDICRAASNSGPHVDGFADVAAAADWPVPVGGFRLRRYALAQYSGAPNISRIFRSTNLMVNVMDVYQAARDSRALMPHSHEAYEQITLCMAGPFMHHLRTPWLPDASQWRADEHLEVGSPSALVIPPRLIHTTQALDRGCWLIDVFGPPRMDFSKIDGMVRNHAEYPMPASG